MPLKATDDVRAVARRPAAQPLNLTADAQDVLSLIAQERQAGRHAVLAAIVGLTGSSVRSVGALMAVLADGRYSGSFSGGCIEAAIVAEALDALDAGAAREVRFGAGSRYVDARLPCGGSVDIFFLPDPSLEQVGPTLAALRERKESVLALGSATLPVVRYAPRLRVIVIGQGAETVAMLAQAQAFHADVELLTSEALIAGEAAKLGITARMLLTPQRVERINADPWTAVVLLFHDHGWELEILRAAFATPAFWIGAMGGQKTREARVNALRLAGFDEVQIERIRSPIGLIPSARDPATLALSALAEIVQAFRRRDNVQLNIKDLFVG